jgi:hypothetical protein
VSENEPAPEAAEVSLGTGSGVSPVSPVLPIISTIVWLLLVVPTLIVAAFSAMLFDSGGSTPAVLVFAGFWLTLPLTLISISASWILWGFTRRKRSTGLKVARGVAYLLPLIGLGLAGVGLLWINTACSGNLSC